MKEIKNSEGKVVRIEISVGEIDAMGEREFIDFVCKNGEFLPHQIIDEVVTPRMESYMSNAESSASDILHVIIAGLPFLVDSLMPLIKRGAIEIDEIDVDCLQYCVDRLNEVK